MHDREQIYRQLWEYADRLGMLTKTQQELAKILGIPYQRLSVICREFQDLGRMKKYRSRFQVVDPDSLTWEGYRSLLTEVRSRGKV